MKTGKKIKSYIPRLLTLAAYAVFFTIQLTAYIDPAGNVHLPKRIVSIQTSSIVKYEAGITNTDHASKKTGLRLNRRFHPQPVLLFDLGFSSSPGCLFGDKISCIYSGPSVITSILSDQSQRGPPVIG